MSIAFIPDSPSRFSPTGRMINSGLEFRDFQLEAMQRMDIGMQHGQLLLLGPFRAPGRRSMGGEPNVIIRPQLILRLEHHNWVGAANIHAPSAKFNKRTRNKFLGIENPKQIVNSNKYTKKKTKRKSK